jgi:PEP-CTERM motif
MKATVLVLLIGSLVCGTVNAAITPAIDGSPTGSDPYTWNYQISVDSLEQLVAASSTPCATAASCGSFFTIYDFAGYVANSALAPTGWTVQIQLVGLTNSTQNPTDNSSIVNATFVYVGTPSPDPGPIGPVGGFSLESIYSTINTGGTFTYQAEKLDGTQDAGIGSIDIPEQGSVPNTVPEPASIALACLGLVGIGVARRSRVKVAAALGFALRPKTR